jgi:hypothetical protein
MTTPALIPSPTVEVLEYAGVPKNQIAQPLGRLVVLLAQRYGLDPALKHVEVIETKGRLSVYITADGWSFIADRSGEWDGLTFVDVEHVLHPDDGRPRWHATAHVWRKGCTHPFEGRAACLDAEDKPDREAQAMTRATRRALRRAFASKVRVEPEYAVLFAERDDAGSDEDPEPVDDDAPIAPVGRAAESAGSGVLGPTVREHVNPEHVNIRGNPQWPASAATSRATAERVSMSQGAAHAEIGALSDVERAAFMARHGITDFGALWPDAALADALGSGTAVP